jgi:hypothetical protein
MFNRIREMVSVLVQSASSILRLRSSTDPLKRWGDHIAKTRGKKIAGLALARLSRKASVDCRAWDPVLLANMSDCGLRETLDQLNELAETLRRTWR